MSRKPRDKRRADRVRAGTGRNPRGPYPFEIPSRDAVLDYLRGVSGPAPFDEIARNFRLRLADRREAMLRRLQAMVRDGQLAETRAGYGLASRLELMRGRVIGHPDGFAFVVTEEPGDDVFLPPREARCCLHGDKVLIGVTGIDRRGRPEGRVVEVLERANQDVVGRFFNERGIGVVVPDNRRINQDILIPAGKDGRAAPGQIVIARIVAQPDRARQPVGEIIDIVGDHMAPGMEIDIAIRAHELPHVWPAPVTAEATGIARRLPRDEVARRIDLRSWPFVTIDGDDARDFDDAVYCRRVGRLWKLFVAIADVSYYVAADSAIDAEAYVRGNSVYFPDHVIPMLPEVLANELCSLKPDVDRFAVVCELTLDSRGEVQEAAFFEAVIRSRARLTYSEVGAAISKPPQLSENLKPVRREVDELHALYRLLLARRERRGALEIDTVEPRIVFDEQRKIASFTAQRRNDAHRMIEEFMVAANVAAAEFLIGEELASLFRVHERPDAEKIDNLRQLVRELGLSVGGGEQPAPRHFARLLQQAHERPFAHLIETVVLRTMKMAVYSPENTGHFGLAYEAYMHFTSPIRRYPDLIVHRAIKCALNGNDCDPYEYSLNTLRVFGDHCSMTERRADEATRDAINWLKCEFMLDKVGATFNGTITGVTGFGFFVELDDLFVEGLVHVTSLRRDYYHFERVHHRLRGERSGAKFQLGDRISVRVARVSLDDRQIDLEAVDETRNKDRAR